MDREHFMDFFRNDEKLEQLTPDDRIEIFLNVLLGSSDIDVKLLNELLNNYDIRNIVISEKQSNMNESDRLILLILS
ncbi:hypothetical protein KR932_18850 [Acinetobacter baumannii]|uniref:Uncharacterized protein n=6 Tax=Moraxellaceae TaxID=468 RepID=A0ABD5DC12_ACIBA|nr:MULTISPECIES: hypothetical protein [Acinetobacter calcoaceticus/baumannii complex]AII26423.1 hypothetical protein M3Q_pABCC20 [Acinetobacter baumannii TYTH-1]AOX79485.1 hypothetical protein KAB03_03926 [Acinetobacter baumannii]AVN12660.1 hypothetical protein C6N18_00210 [Acinetobacter baumannii]AZB89790.1 hypothetical protein DKE39_019835 [Acinetobacter baumannii]EKU1747161.1 hypothetical protein [Acinetobacter baumannii]